MRQMMQMNQKQKKKNVGFLEAEFDNTGKKGQEIKDRHGLELVEDNIEKYEN